MPLRFYLVGVLRYQNKSDFSSDKCAAYGKRSGYQNIHFILRPYFVQHKYVPHKKLSPKDQQRPQQGAPSSLRTSALYLLSYSRS
jgi:hypothetical protein